MDFDTAVKLKIYEVLGATARAPSISEVARELGAPVAEVEAAFKSLHKKRLLVPEPGDPSRIRMAVTISSSGASTRFPTTAI